MKNHSRGSAWVGTCDLSLLDGRRGPISRGEIAETYKISVASGGIKPGKPLYREISVSLGGLYSYEKSSGGFLPAMVHASFFNFAPKRHRVGRQHAASPDHAWS